MSDALPRTFEEAMAWARARLDETGETPKSVANPTAGLVFDLKNRTFLQSARRVGVRKEKLLAVYLITCNCRLPFRSN
jgi:hypothetical protein